MVQNDYTESIITDIKDDSFINWAEEEKVFQYGTGHFDERVLVLDQGLYVIRER